MGEVGHPQVNSRVSSGAQVGVGELLFSAGQADLESFDLAVPSFPLGLRDAGDQIVADVGQPCPLGRIRSEERASDTSVLMDAGRSEGACASADGHLPLLEVG